MDKIDRMAKVTGAAARSLAPAAEEPSCHPVNPVHPVSPAHPGPVEIPARPGSSDCAPAELGVPFRQPATPELGVWRCLDVPDHLTLPSAR